MLNVRVRKLVFASLVMLLAALDRVEYQVRHDLFEIRHAQRIASENARKLPREIWLPRSLPRLMGRNEALLDAVRGHCATVLTYASTGCYACVRTIASWSQVLRQLSKGDSLAVGSVFIIASPTRAYARTLLSTLAWQPKVVFYDSNRTILSANGIREPFFTALLDTACRVVIAGSPVLHSGLQRLYEHKLDSLCYRNRSGS